MIYFLVPVYNEEENLERLFNETSRYMNDAGYKDFCFIFVNDGSTDNSLEIMKKFQIQEKSTIILSHMPNKGVKQTFLEGFEGFIKVAKKGDLLITKEADNTSDNTILKNMIESLFNQEADIVLASCYKKGGGFESTNFFRMILSSSANLLIKLRFNLWGLYTFSSFYRAFSYECLEKSFNYKSPIMTYDGFTCVVEMLIKLKRMGFTIREIPMTLKSSERKGPSKMPVIKTILEYIRLCLSGIVIEK